MTESIMHFNASLFSQYPDFLDHLTRSIGDAKPELFLVYEGLQPTWVESAWLFLETQHEDLTIRKSFNSKVGVFTLHITPSYIHNAIEPWQAQCQMLWHLNSLITLDECLDLHAYHGATLEFREGRYRGSRKEPDVFIQSIFVKIPTLVMECGWAESSPALENDMNLLLVGGNGAVKRVFIVKWTRHSDYYHVSGFIKVFKLDCDGMPVQEGPIHTIFPAPSNSQDQRISICRKDLFAGSPYANINPNGMLDHPIDLLRKIAALNLDRMGLTPST
ncbi:hypothetical protein BDV38DRAFT_61302 [Aspergillus pseudotamarii]|uniref:Uncharacterized protein n=1 Tax=Aspergillus pseudotamarii TaxID=132259 RepID=A0A5N6SW24_ASPPS|nr:uncharacterized protein BDV38DRAFT_61302 [Aspergillus pseudotamarii]KAE8138832.1 hypothetical protein BDV38DRAFT_61302 [Aspergillus pseudotamarii]